jgi:CRISPR-associated protein Cas2
MQWILVIYDISNDKTRLQVCDACKDYGLDRRQYSVFTGQLKTRQLRALKKELQYHIREGGHVMIFPVDRESWAKHVEIGQAIHG